MDQTTSNREVLYRDIYVTKRLFTFLDEWLLYFLLYTVIVGGHHWLYPVVITIIGTCMIITAYAELDKVGEMLGIPGVYYIFPFRK